MSTRPTICEPDACDATRLAYELGATVRRLPEANRWNHTELARLTDMSQSAIARFEAGGTIPVLQRLAHGSNGLDVATYFADP